MRATTRRAFYCLPRGGTTFFLIFLLQSVGSAQEKLGYQDLPEAVIESLQNEVQGAEIGDFKRSIGDVEHIYRVEVDTDRGREMEFFIRVDGRVLKKEVDGQMRILNGNLFMGEDPFWIQAIHTPEIGNPSQPAGILTKTISQVSDVGASAIAFDVFGYNEDGTSLSPESVEHVRSIEDELLDYDIGGLCRVLGPESPKTPEGRLNAVRTAARAFCHDPQLVYWIDGEDADELAQAFSQIAPELLVAAPNGAMRTVNAACARGEAPPCLVIAEGDFTPMKATHFLLPPEDSSYEKLDDLYIWPIEKEPPITSQFGLAPEEREEGFVSLFDGKTLKGWTSIRSGQESFVAKDGTIEWVRRGSGAIQAQKRYSDFIFRCEFKISEGGNSGVHFRVPRANRASKIGFEVQILGDYGSPPSDGGTGAIYSAIAPTVNASKPAGEWNALEVIADGPHVQVTLNGQKVQDVNFDDDDALRYRLRKGFLRLTDHGNPVSYRKIRIKEL